MQPRDQLFATLDVTAHAGTLPSLMKVIYVDTVGFISDIPTSLIDAFIATLEDVLNAVSFVCKNVYRDGKMVFDWMMLPRMKCKTHRGFPMSGYRTIRKS